MTGASGAGLRNDEFRSVWVLFYLLLVLYAILFFRTAWIADDAFITYRTVDNFIHGHGLRWNVAERVQTYTHPLWMWLHVPVYGLSGNPYFTGLLLCALCSFAVPVFLFLSLKDNLRTAIIALSGLLASRAYLDYSSSGLENPLTHLLLSAFLYLYLSRQPSERRFFVMSLLAGLATFNRMDSLLLFLLPLLHVLFACRSRRKWALLLLAFSPFILWELFSLVYYGFLFPNTAYAKLGAGMDIMLRLKAVAAYVYYSLTRDPVTLILIAAGIYAGLRSGLRMRMVALSGILYLMLLLYFGGDYMGGRFFTAPLLLSMFLLAKAAMQWRSRKVWMVTAGIFLFGMFPGRSNLLSGPGYGAEADRNNVFGEGGVANERAFYFPSTGLMASAGNDGLLQDAICVADSLKNEDQPLFVEGCVGFLGYYAGPKVHILDYHALGDPLLARLPALYTNKPRPGHLLRIIPSGYVEHLQGESQAPLSPELRNYISDLERVTRGDIWSPERWKTIFRFLIHASDLRLDPESFRLPRVVPRIDSVGEQLFPAGGGLVLHSIPRSVQAIRLKVKGGVDFRIICFEKGQPGLTLDTDLCTRLPDDWRQYTLPSRMESLNADSLYIYPVRCNPSAPVAPRLLDIRFERAGQDQVSGSPGSR